MASQSLECRTKLCQNVRHRIIKMALQEKKKLTLRLHKRLIEQAKQYAAQHNISVSELVETFFLNLETVDESEHSPLFSGVNTQ